jgi:hypothetical protein
MNDTVCPYSTTMQELEDFGLACLCGGENFERVIVKRPSASAYVTEFVACVSCRVMFHLPLVAGAGDPQFKDDAAKAAKDYRKPSRKPGRR